MNLLIDQAMAADGPGVSTGYFEPLLLLGFIALFYFLIWRPQSKRTKAHRQLIGGLIQGDEIISSGGVMGRVVKIAHDHLVLKIASGVDIGLQKNAVVATLPKGTLKAMNASGVDVGLQKNAVAAALPKGTLKATPNRSK